MLADTSTRRICEKIFNFHTFCKIVENKNCGELFYTFWFKSLFSFYYRCLKVRCFNMSTLENLPIQKVMACSKKRNKNKLIVFHKKKSTVTIYMYYIPEFTSCLCWDKTFWMEFFNYAFILMQSFYLWIL